jgi:TetR/AcrR family transcriptional repressor of nem operon
MRTANPNPQAKEKIILAATRLFLEKGYAATSVDEICEAAGLTKGSFFHYFASKEDLASAALDRFCDGQQKLMMESPFLQKADPLERVLGNVDFAIDFSKKIGAQLLQGGGCLLGTFSDELSRTHPEIRNQCAQKFASWAEAIRRDLDLAVEKHKPKTRIDTLALAENFIATLEGAILLAKAKQDTAVIEHSMENYRLLVKTLFGITSFGEPKL